MHTVATTLAALEFGAPDQHQNLAVFPLRAKSAGPDEAAYLVLDEALAAGLARVTEVSEGGSVPELAFENLADRPVLLVDGDELVGAKQNRVLNITILVAAGRKITIPVSCVERGRWGYRTRHFGAARHKLYLKARAFNAAHVSEFMRASGERRSDQGAIWADIEDKMARLEAASPTSSMEDMYEQKSRELTDYLKAFEPSPGQRGAVFTVNGQVAGIELFDSAAAFKRCFPKVLSSYALDALDVQEPCTSPVADGVARCFLEELEHAAQERFPAVGEGTDLRLSGSRLAGGALLVGERVVHLAAFRLE
jgi:hypothetical protein